jgi:hypothetical protein
VRSRPHSWRTVPDDELLAAAHDLAAHAARHERGLTGRLASTFAEMASVTAHGDAGSRELELQLWSFAQRAFRDRVAAMRASISSRRGRNGGEDR